MCNMFHLHNVQDNRRVITNINNFHNVLKKLNKWKEFYGYIYLKISYQKVIKKFLFINKISRLYEL